MMNLRFGTGVALMILCGAVFAAETGAGDREGAQSKASAAERDAIELCEKLAGTEREICMRQARENRRAIEQSGIGSTPGDGARAAGAVKTPETRSGASAPSDGSAPRR